MATPTLIQHVASTAVQRGVQPASGGNGYVFTLPNKVRPGNCLILGISYAFNASRTVTITDNNSNSWTGTLAVGPITDASNNLTSAIYVLPNANAGFTTITITFEATPVQPFQYTISEFNNVATVSPVNGTTTANGTTAPSLSAGSFTPGNNNANGGNLIWSHFIDNAFNTSNSTTAFTAGASFTLLNADISWGGSGQTGMFHATQYFVQATSAALTPTMTATMTAGNDNYNALTVALKAASAGTAAPLVGIRIIRICHFTNTAPPTAWKVQFPCIGNLIVFVSAQQGNIVINSVTDNNGNTWSKVEPATDEAQFWIAGGATPGSTLLVTINTTAGGANDSLLFYDIINADTSVGTIPSVDGSAGLTGGGISAGTNFIDNCPSITPASIGLTLAAVSYGTGPGNGFHTGAPSEAVFDYVFYTGEADTDRMDNADGRAHLYNSDLTTENWNWTISHTAGTTAPGSAVHFKSLPTSTIWIPQSPALLTTHTSLGIRSLASAEQRQIIMGSTGTISADTNTQQLWAISHIVALRPSTVIIPTFDPSSQYPWPIFPDFAGRQAPRPVEFPAFSWQVPILGAGKAFYFKNVAVGAGGHGSLADGVIPTPAITNTLISMNKASNIAALQIYAGSATLSGTPQPANPPNTTGDSWRSESTINGTFSAGVWTFSLVESSNNLGSSKATLSFRIWKSTNANGASATELTSGIQATVSDGILIPSQLAVSIGAVTFNNEYLFVQIGWVVTP